VKEVDESLNEIIGDHPWILDVDLDYFSTLNPFLSIYPKALTYQKLKEIFHIEKSYDKDDPESIAKYVEKRNRHLDFFEKVFQCMMQNGTLEKFEVNDEEMRDKFNLTKELIASLCHHYSIYDIDWFVINDAGCTTDEDELQLPHHESSSDEIKEAVKRFEVCLKSIKKVPEIITISRSASDGYTPPHQIEMIQDLVVKALNNVYAESIAESPTLWYKNSSNIPALELVEPRQKKRQ
jgi:DNA-binding protein YbaB